MDIPTILLIPLGILVVAIWYWIKIILRNHDYKIDMFREHTRDIANFHDLVTWEKNPRQKKQYTILLAAFYIALLATLGNFLVYFANVFNNK